MTDLDRLKKAFATALGLPAAVDFEHLAYRETAQWDSVAHMTLVMEIETEFDIMLPTQDVIGLSDFSKARMILMKHGVTVGS